MMETSIGNSGTTLKNQKQKKKCGDKEKGGENEEKKKKKTKDTYVQGKEKGKI